jgi:hypothetical protein
MFYNFVIPAQAGIQSFFSSSVPAFAEMTRKG